MHRPEDTGSRRRRRGEPDEPIELPPEDGLDGEGPDEEPLYVFTCEQAREVDRLCAKEFGIPSIILMENAALGVASVAREVLEDGAPSAVLVFAGPGSNGGDGLAAARHLANDGARVAVVLAVPPQAYKSDARTNLVIAEKMRIPLESAEPDPDAAITRALKHIGEPDLIIDALLGTGINRPAEGVIARLIERINGFKERAAVLSVDAPSGLDAETGQPVCHRNGNPGPVVKADVTVALLGVKPGYLTLAAQQFVGDCLVAGIGAPRSLIERLGSPVNEGGVVGAEEEAGPEVHPARPDDDDDNPRPARRRRR